MTIANYSLAPSWAELNADTHLVLSGIALMGLVIFEGVILGLRSNLNIVREEAYKSGGWFD